MPTDTHERLLKTVQIATRKLASSGNLDRLLPDVLGICVEIADAEGGTIYLHDPGARRLRFQYVLPRHVAGLLPFPDIPDDFGVAGRVFHSRRTEISELREQVENPRAQIEASTGIAIRTLLTVPLMLENEEPIGVVQLINKRGGGFTESDTIVLDTVAAVCAMAVVNSRLAEDANKAALLMGMGKVSHDIGNLAANLSATVQLSEMAVRELSAFLPTPSTPEMTESRELLSDAYGELRLSIDQVVGYSRLISDLSAGRPLRPVKRSGRLAPVIRRAASYLQSDGQVNHVGMRFELEDDAPAFLFDELYVTRIVQNLVGNAIKAMRDVIPDSWRPPIWPEGERYWGEVTVRYQFQDPRHLIEVADVGRGMAPELVARIRAGLARSDWVRSAGSGWGMRIVLELAAAHDGEVFIESEPGRGTTVRIALPHIVDQAFC